MSSRGGLVFSLCVSLLLAVTAAQATDVLVVSPDLFEPFLKPNTKAYTQDGGQLWPSGDGSSNTFVAIVSLPVGKTVSKLAYYHRGMNVAHSRVELRRARPAMGIDVMGSCESTSTSGFPVLVEDTTIGSGLVSAYYRYFIIVTLDNKDTVFLGAKIYLD
jgi:hypothetical protein